MIGSKQVQAIAGVAWIILFATGCNVPPSPAAIISIAATKPIVRALFTFSPFLS